MTVYKKHYDRYPRPAVGGMTEWCINHIGKGRKWSNTLLEDDLWAMDMVVGIVFFYFAREDDYLAFTLVWG